MRRNFGELPARRDGWLDLRHRLDPRSLELLEDVAGAVGGVTVDRGRVIAGCRVVTIWVGVGEAGDQVGDRFDITGVARGDRDRGNDLAVGIQGEVTLVPVEAAVVGLVPVP